MNISHRPFYFIRHGESAWNQRHLGGQDIPLNQRGREQATLAAQWLKVAPIGSIVTSPLLRARETAEIIAEILGKPTTLIDDLRAHDSIPQDIPSDENQFLQQWLERNPRNIAETIDIFEARIIRGLNQALESPGPVLIVAHGDVYGVIQRALGVPESPLLKNCGIVHHSPPEHPGYAWVIRYPDGDRGE